MEIKKSQKKPVNEQILEKQKKMILDKCTEENLAFFRELVEQRNEYECVEPIVVAVVTEVGTDG